MNNMEENLLDNKETIELIVDLLKEDNSNVKSKIKELIKKIQKKDKLLAGKMRNVYYESKYENHGLARSADHYSLQKPVTDDNLNLLQEEETSYLEGNEFIWQDNVKKLIDTTIKEHTHRDKLKKLGLEPIKSILFHGVPGVGKTMAAKVLAKELDLPLCILDLSTIMNSYLGKTGNNIRKVFNYAIENNCVLLIDEFDAIAKQRSDESEVGELKRLVTVLLQSIDNWPATSVLIAATNHPELLDKAIWRRFDQVIKFDLPKSAEVTLIINKELKTENIDKDLKEIFIKSCIGLSHGLIKKEINKVLKDMIINEKPIEQVLCENMGNRSNQIERDDKLKIAHMLYSKKILTQRKLAEIFNITRDAIREYSKLQK